MQFAGLRVLVVEDEMLVAMNLEDTLIEMGAFVVGPAMRLDTALQLAETETFDVAILDVNLHGGRSYPVADLLQRRGIPFLFATGYGHSEDQGRFRNIPTLTKPYRNIDLVEALSSAMPSRHGRGQDDLHREGTGQIPSGKQTEGD